MLQHSPDKNHSEKILWGSGCFVKCYSSKILFEKLNTLKLQISYLAWIGSLSAYLKIFFRHTFKKYLRRKRKPWMLKVTSKEKHIAIYPPSLKWIFYQSWILKWEAFGEKQGQRGCYSGQLLIFQCQITQTSLFCPDWLRKLMSESISWLKYPELFMLPTLQFGINSWWGAGGLSLETEILPVWQDFLMFCW